jgi:hypothetical protein
VWSFCRIYLTARTQAKRIFDSHVAESFAAATSAAQAPKSKRRSSTPISDSGPKDTGQPPEEIVISDGLAVGISGALQQQATPSGNGRLDPSAGFVEKQLPRHDEVESDQNGTVVNNSLSTHTKSSDVGVDFSAAGRLSAIAADSSTTAATAGSQSYGPGRRTWKMAAQLVTSAALTSAGARDGVASVGNGNGDGEGRWMTALSRVSKLYHVAYLQR